MSLESIEEVRDTEEHPFAVAEALGIPTHPFDAEELLRAYYAFPERDRAYISQLLRYMWIRIHAPIQ